MAPSLTKEHVHEEVDDAADDGVDDAGERHRLAVGAEHRVGTGEDHDGRESGHQRRVGELGAVPEEARDGHLSAFGVGAEATEMS